MAVLFAVTFELNGTAVLFAVTFEHRTQWYWLYLHSFIVCVVINS